MTRIGLLAPYAPPIPGGISSFVSGLRAALEQRGDEVFLFAGEGNGDRPVHPNLGTGRQYVHQAQRSLDTVRPDVIHCHSHWYTLAAGVRYLAKNPNARLVFSFHTTTLPHLRRLFANLLSKAQVLTFVSSAQLAEIRFALQLGGDLRILRPATRLTTVDPRRVEEWKRSQDLESAFPILAFAGPLEYPRKVAGVVDLVKAFRNIRRRYPRARLLIIGDGSLRSRVEEAGTDLGGAMTVTGFVDDPRVALSCADLYCQISRQEGLPIALLEAMSLGRCVIATRVGGIPEILDDSNGLLVGSEPQDIEKAVYSLLEDPHRRDRFAVGARRTIERSYAWDARLPQIDSIYGLAG